jgi:hypothetical protein
VESRSHEVGRDIDRDMYRHATEMILMGSRRSAGVYVTEDIDEEYLSNLERSRSDSEKMKRVWAAATVTCVPDSRACHCVFAFERFSVIEYLCSRAHMTYLIMAC